MVIELDPRGLRPAGQQLAEHARGRRLADRDRPGDPDDERGARRVLAEEGRGRRVQPVGRCDVQVEQPATAGGRRRPPRPGRSGRRGRAAARGRRRSAGSGRRGGQPAPGLRGRGRRTAWRGRTATGAVCPSGSAWIARGSTCPTRLRCMCGIVGYVGAASVRARPLDVVMGGLRRLEYRGYDSAGVALVVPAANVLVPPRRPGKLANLARRSRPSRSRPRPRPSGTPGGPPTAAPTDVNAHPHLVGGRPARRHPQRDHRELRAAAAPSSRPTGVSSLSETDTEVAAHLLAAEYAAHRRPAPRRCARSPPRLRGRLHAARRARRRARTSSSAPGTTPRSSSGWARARTSSAPTSRRSSRTPARPSSSGQDQVVTITPTAVGVTDFDGQRRSSARRYTVDWDAAAAEKGGFASFMDKEIDEQPQAVADTLLGRTDADGPADARRDAGRRGGAAARSTRSSSSRAGPPRTPGRWPSTPSSTGAGSPSRWSSRTSSATATRWSTPRPSSSRSPSPGRRWTRSWRCGTRGSRGRRCSRSCNTHGLDDPARVRRRALHPRRPRGRGRVDQGVPRPDHRGLPARSVPGPAAGHQVPRRDRRDPRRAAGDAGQDPARCSTAPDQVRAARALDGRHAVGALPRPARRATRSRWRARSSSRSWPTSTPRASPRASSSTARSRSSTPGSRCSSSCPRRAGGTRCTARSSRTSRRSAPAAPAPS